MSLSANYSKWDKMDVSDSEDEDDFSKPRPKNDGAPAVAAAVDASPDTIAPATAVTQFGQLGTLVRESCTQAMTSAAHVTIDEVALTEFVQQINADAVAAAVASLKFSVPLKMDNVSQVNFAAIIRMLDLGTAWVPEITKHTGENPLYSSTLTFDHILMGMLGGFLSGHSFDSDDLIALGGFEVGTITKLPWTEEKCVSGPMYQDVASGTRPLIDRYLQAFNTTGRVMKERGFANLGAFIVAERDHGHGSQSTKDGDATAPTRTADDSLRRMVEALPFLQDEYVHKDARVAVYRRAALLVGALHYGIIGAAPLSDASNLPPLAGALEIAELLHHKVLVPSSALKKKLDAGSDIKVGSEEEVELRAAAVVALDKAAKVCAERQGTTFSSFELSVFCNSAARKQLEAKTEGFTLPVCRGTSNY